MDNLFLIKQWFSIWLSAVKVSCVNINGSAEFILQCNSVLCQLHGRLPCSWYWGRWSRWSLFQPQPPDTRERGRRRDTAWSRWVLGKGSSALAGLWRCWNLVGKKKDLIYHLVLRSAKTKLYLYKNNTIVFMPPFIHRSSKHKSPLEATRSPVRITTALTSSPV